VPPWLLFIQAIYGVVIAGCSGILWKSGGVKSCHSSEVERCDETIIGRCATKASHRMKINKSRAMNEIIDPIDDTTFHFVKASG